MAYTYFLLVVSVLLAVGFFVLSSTSRPEPGKRSRYAPGPPGKLLVGNLPDIPERHSWLKFKEWSDQYGPLFRFNKVANDLLRERGGIYSSREQLPAAVKLLSKDLRPLFWPYDDTWREGRKLMHQVTNATVVGTYQLTQNLESARMLRDLIQKPSKYEHWFERYSSGIIFRLAFGKTIQTGDEYIVRQIIEVVHMVERVASPGAYLVDVFSLLMCLQKAMSPFKRELEGLHQRELKLFRKLLHDVKDEMQTGTAPQCWFRGYLERASEFKLTEDEAAYVIGTLFEAGADMRSHMFEPKDIDILLPGTTAAAMMSFMLAVVLRPTWLAKLQSEVDSVCGTDRLSTLNDMPRLPIVRAVIKEVLRWRPVTAGGVPHYSTRGDDVYNGMFIPAGTNVHANQWAIHREEALYPDAESFNPDRWLDPSYPTYREPLTTYPNLHNYSCFGFGRRICPGQNIAERSMYLQVARVAWMCDVRKKRDEKGEEVVPPFVRLHCWIQRAAEVVPIRVDGEESEEDGGAGMGG
ncbi:hypothetical protein DOTSEDRAFT_81157 [Dothistroma septosporum NZE10]|uniref:Cytochrome P450 n=1 Tax=Dothistroma septosporum (strain NZE10 / CBS 128990) TaxID=675120 RepID=N1PKY4_DOTSN|nr:hypothetical protein DOTSEDRAFT_81157 [Dothistroma septosporum NZE10]